MSAQPSASLLDAVLALALTSTDPGGGNRVALEGLNLGPREDGTLGVAIRKLEAAGLRVVSGPLVLEIGRLVLEKVAALVHFVDGRPQLRALEAASLELSGVKAHGPLVLPWKAQGSPYALRTQGGAAAAGSSVPDPRAAGAWCLAFLADAQGTVRAKITDAHLLFDADVTVPIRDGKIEFNDATVEHVGPDSRMGVSRLGLYVDAPNGRSYLYQFASAPAGVEFERRGAMLGPFVTDRGNLRLQPFAEGLMQQPPATQAMGFTEQARVLFERTSVSGEVRPGDGRFAAPGVQADLVGRGQGRNVVRVQSEAVGRGFTLDIPSVSARNAVLGGNEAPIRCEQVEAALVLRLQVEGPQLRFAFDLTSLKASGLRLQARN